MTKERTVRGEVMGARSSRLREAEAGQRFMALVVGVAFALRLYHIGHESLWFDEILSGLAARLPLNGLLSMLSTWNQRPPAYYFLLRIIVSLVGDASPAVPLRLLSAFAGTLTVPLLYRLARALWSGPAGRTAGLLAAAFCAVAPLQVRYSQEASGHALLVLALTLAAWGLAMLLREAPGRGWAMVWLGGATLALYTNTASLLSVTGLALIGLLFAFRQAPRRWAGALVLLGLPFALFLAWPTHRQLILTAWHAVTAASPGAMGAMSGALLERTAHLLGAGESSPFGFALGWLALCGALVLVVRREWWPLTFLLVWSIPPALSLLILPRTPPPDRYLIVWAPAFLLLVARAILWIGGSVVPRLPRTLRPKPAVAIGGVLCAAAFLPGLLDYYGEQKQDWRGLAKLVGATPGVPLHAPWIADVVGYYLPESAERPVLDFRAPDELAGALRAAERSWVVSTEHQPVKVAEQRLGGAWQGLPLVDLELVGKLHLLYVGPDATPGALVREIAALPLPDSAPVWLSLAGAARAAGETSIAKSALDKGLSLVSLATRVPGRTLVLAADRANQAGRFAEALPLYREAVRRGEVGPQVLLSLAVSANALGYPDEALAAMARLPATEQGGYWPRRIPGDAYFRKGQYTVARTWLLAADLASPGTPDVAALLAMVGEELGDRQGATRWWQRYLTRAPEGSLRDRACNWLVDNGAAGDCAR